MFLSSSSTLSQTRRQEKLEVIKTDAVKDLLINLLRNF